MIMNGSNAVANLNNASDQDFIVLYMIGAGDISALMDVLSDAKNNGVQISLGSSEDAYGISTIDTSNPPHNVIVEYLANDGDANMDNRNDGRRLCRCPSDDEIH